MNYIIDPEKLKAELIPLTMEKRGELITRKVAEMLSGRFEEDWGYPDKEREEKSSVSLYTERFEAFWKAYHPGRRTGKGAALKAWKKVAKNIRQEEDLLNGCLNALRWQLKSKQWIDGFVPLPATYLNQRRWEDDPPENQGGFFDINGIWQDG